jgi:cytochrome bd ubiquinol oxidase subunit II
MLYTAPVPILVLGCAWLLYKGIEDRRELQPFLAALGLFILCYIGLAISFYPYIVPVSVTIWEAAAPDNSLKFLLAGTLVLVPLILAYTAWSYWVFRGKVSSEGGYH